MPDIPSTLVLHTGSGTSMQMDNSNWKDIERSKGFALKWKRFIALTTRKLAYMLARWIQYTIVFVLTIVAVISTLLRYEPAVRTVSIKLFFFLRKSFSI